jgi:Tol biopolymer transport system component
MATVYLAHDPQSNSLVAIKVLRDALSAVVGRERFLREVRIASKLEHPGIVRVLDSSEAGQIIYCVMPYVAGETLKDLLAREKQLPVARAVALGCEIADALEFAHNRGIVHRDIKPANILLAEGRPLVADFGIARAIGSSADTASITTSGVIIGTPAYMAPEQAADDRELDGRADIYALGCVVYESLVGEPPFSGLTAWNVTARHAAQPPMPIRAIRPRVPPAVEKVIMRALEKTPADRFPTAKEFGAALAEAGKSAPGIAPMWRWMGAAALVLGVGGAGWFAATSRAPRAATPQAISFVVPPPTGAHFSDNLRDVSAVSPDGRDIVLAGTDSAGTPHLWLRHLADRAATRIPGTDMGAQSFWSPDGKSIAFFQRRSLVVIDRLGGTGRIVATTSLEPRGGSWADNGTILFAPGSQTGIFATSATDTSSRRLTTPSASRGEIGHMWPQALPGGRAFIYFVASDADSVRGIYLASMDAPSGRRVAGSSASAVYSGGYLLYVYAGALVAQRLDVSSASLVGDRRVIADSVATSYEYYGAFSASETGVLVYAGGRSRDIARLTWMDSTGVVRGYASQDGYLRNPDLSADGRFLAFETYRETDSDIQYVDLTSGVGTVLPDKGLQAVDPVWSPDGSSLAFIAERPGEWAIFRKEIGRAGDPVPVITSPHAIVLMDWTHGDEFLVAAERNPSGDWDLIGRRLAKPDEPVLLAGGPGHQVSAKVSPDGKYLAYVSTESGTPQVYAQPFPATGARCQISAAGGYQSAWDAAPGVLYFLTSSGAMMRTTLDLARPAPCPTSAPRKLFQTELRNPSGARSYFDVSLSDRRLLVNAPSVHEGAWLTVITQWPRDR